MELPPHLRQAIDRALHGVPQAELAAAAAALSERYRADKPAAAPHVASGNDALAYCAVRLPATYAAVHASLDAVRHARPDFAPRALLDIGAGPGTALWAASALWPALAEAVLVEPSASFRACGEALASGAPLPRIEWHSANILANISADILAGIASGASADPVPGGAPRDLVTASYLLNELPEAARPRLIERLWQATAGVLVIVEPGTPAGFSRIHAARDALIRHGANVIAPCPHAHACPLVAPDWCHFAARVARSRRHRLAKAATVPWEDEKFSYVALAREPAPVSGARIIARPRAGSGRVTLKLCNPDGAAGERLFSRRDGAAYKRAARVGWGDVV